MMKESSRSFIPQTLQVLFASLASCAVTTYADLPVGLVGGAESSDGYAAYINQGNTLTSLSVPPATNIEAVGINNTGLGIVAGSEAGVRAYAAFVQPDGTTTSIGFPDNNGQFSTAHINDMGLGLVTGRITPGLQQALYLSSDGNILYTFDLDDSPFDFDNLYAAAMNDLGVGLVGGEGGSGLTAVAAYLYPNGDSVPFPDEFASGDRFFAVAINNSSQGLVGGQNFGPEPYAALITPDKEILFLSSFPSGSGAILTAAINDQGTGLIGGEVSGGNAYAAYVAPNGDLTSLFDPLFSGSINRSAINGSGIGIIGGSNDVGAYAALVQPNGSVLSLLPEETPGSITGVAINDVGLGLIGGNISGSYLALVAPNGTLTEISTSASSISSVSLLQAIADEAVPGTAGSLSSPMYTQMTLGSTQRTRFIQKNKLWNRGGLEEPTLRGSMASHEFAYNEAVADHSLLGASPEVKATPGQPSLNCEPNSIWLEPFGTYIHLKGKGDLPNYSNSVGGFSLGYDREAGNWLVGTSFGYAFNHVNFSSNVGHGNLQQELGSIYSVYYAEHFWVATTLWGGGYQLHNTRHTLGQVSSLGDVHGWILTPGLEMASPWEIGTSARYYVEPFFILNYINGWQASYTETGDAGLNLQMPSTYTSLLQSEVGLRFYERISFDTGDLCLMEKIAYANLAPYGDKTALTSFVGSASSFPVAVATPDVQNLGSFQFLGAFLPKESAQYGGFSFETMAGSSFQYYFGSVFWGVKF